MTWNKEFSDFDGRIWLNTSHQGAIPLRSARAVKEAVGWKLSPKRLTPELFQSVPQRVRSAIAHLIGATAEDVVLSNGASHGQHLWAEGMGLGESDEVLLMAGDFPSSRLPWLRLAREGVTVRDVPSQFPVPSAEEVASAISEKTRVLSLSWVHSFSGRRADLDQIGTVCRDAGVTFLVNTTQGVGHQPLDVQSLPVDGVTNAGWKWLCGPYATGFCWMRPEFRDRLDSRRAYWLAFQTARDLESAGDPDPSRDVGARRFDLFGTANFFQFHPWAEALELLLEAGIEAIREHDFGLASRVVDGVDRSRFRVVGSEPPASAIVVLEPLRRAASEVAVGLEKDGVDVAVRKGMVRLSPHLYNTEQDIDRALEGLGRAS